MLEGTSADAIRNVLRQASVVATSRLTLAEIGRVLARLRVLESAAAARVAAREMAFLADSELWAIHPVDEDVLARCGRPFPVEPVRVMDAIHLATIEKLSSVLGRIVVLSTDDRVRRNAEALGFGVRP